MLVDIARPIESNMAENLQGTVVPPAKLVEYRNSWAAMDKEGTFEKTY
jgi:hypothetical protein